MSEASNHLYEFGEFRLDPVRRLLLRGNDAVALPPKVFETLALLVERRGEIVSKAEMMNAIWADAFVEESNLTQNIYTLRRVLGVDENGTNFIENVPRRGYRFAAPVSLVGSAEEDSALPRVGPQIAPQKSKSFTAIIAAAVALLILGTAGFMYFRLVEVKKAAPLETVNFRKLTYTGDLTFPVMAPDGRSIAFVRGGGVFVQNVESGNEMRLNVEGEKVFGILQFAPDGESLCYRNAAAFDLAASVLCVSRFGGSSKLVAENVWSGFGFSPDGKQIAFVRMNPKSAESNLIVKNLETGVEHKLAGLTSPSTFLDNGHPAWSPDGKNIAIVIFDSLPRAPASRLVIVGTETGEIVPVNQGPLWQFEQVAWLPGSSALIVSARENGKFFQLWRIAYPGGELQKITNDLNIYRGLSLSADGSKILARQFTLYSHLWIGEQGDLENARQKTFGNLNRDGISGLHWMPNGDVLYIARIMGDYDLWLYDPVDDSRHQLTKDAGRMNRDPVASADGRSIFFMSSRSGANHIWRMEASGANQTQVTFGEKENEIRPQISPDGAWLYYIQKSPNSSTIWRKSLTDGRTDALTEAGKFAPDSFLSISPDGKFLAFHNSTEKNVNEDAPPQIYEVGVVPTDGSQPPKFFSISASRLIMRWSADASALDYIHNDAQAARIYRTPLATKAQPTLIAEFPGNFLHNFAWNADGSRLVMSLGRQSNDAILLTNF